MTTGLSLLGLGAISIAVVITVVVLANWVGRGPGGLA